MYNQDVFRFAEIRLASSSETSRHKDQRLQTLKLQGELLIEIEDFVFAIRNPIRKELSSDFNAVEMQLDSQPRCGGINFAYRHDLSRYSQKLDTFGFSHEGVRAYHLNKFSAREEVKPREEASPCRGSIGGADEVSSWRSEKRGEDRERLVDQPERRIRGDRDRDMGRGDEGSWRQSGYGSSRSEENQREVREVGDRERRGWEPRPREEPRGFERVSGSAVSGPRALMSLNLMPVEFQQSGKRPGSTFSESDNTPKKPRFN